MSEINQKLRRVLYDIGMAKILIVEDNRINQIVASKMLAGLGVEVSTASDGIEGLEAIKAGNFDLVFMDCQMPNMDGYTATGKLRELEKRGEVNKLPVVALTAHSMPGDRQKCLDAGMDDYLSKPVNEEGFADMLYKWLGDYSGAAISNTEQKYRFKHINANEIEKLFCLMGAGFFDLVDIYFSSMSDLMVSLKEGIGERDFDKILHSAHTIKSPSRQIGSQGVAEKASEIEILAKEQGGMQDIEMKFAILREQLFSANQEIVKYVESKKKELDS